MTVILRSIASGLLTTVAFAACQEAVNVHDSGVERSSDGAVRRDAATDFASDAAAEWRMPEGPSPRDRAVAVSKESAGAGGCVLTESGALWCWGLPYPGSQSSADHLVAERVHGIPPMRAVWSSSFRVSAVDLTGRLWQWNLRVNEPCVDTSGGRNPVVIPSPDAVASAGASPYIVFEDGSCRSFPGITSLSGQCSWHPFWSAGVVGVTFDVNTTCAVLSSGRIECFVDGPPVPNLPTLMYHEFSEVPSEYPGIREVADFQFGSSFQCALTRAGEVWCWGNSWCGETGSVENLEYCDGNPLSPPRCRRRPTPVPGINDAQRMVIRSLLGCVVRQDGTVWCWGSIPRGGFGLRNPQYATQFDPNIYGCLRGPAQIAGLRDVVDFSVGGGWCAVIRDGRVFCLGGLVGDGTQVGSPTPVEVRWE